MARLFGAGGGPFVGGEYWSVFIRRLGATTIEMGVISSISSAINMLLAIPSGWLTDGTSNLKRLYVFGRLLSLPTGLLRFLAKTWPFCILISGWEAISGRIMSPSSEIILIRSLSNLDRIKGLSLRETITSLIGIAGPLISALVITYFGGLESADSIRPLFLIQFVVGIFIFAFEATQLQEVKLTRVKRSVGIVSHLFSIFRDSPILILHLLRECVMTFTWQLTMPFMGIYLVDVKGADQFILGWRGTIATAIPMFFSIPSGYLAERVGRRRLAYYTRFIGWMGTLITIFTPRTHPEFLIVASALQSMFITMFIGWTAFRQESIPLQARGRWSGINILMNGLVGIITPIVGGIIWNLNPDYLWWIGLFCDAFIILPVMIIIGHKVSKTEI